MAWLRIAWAVAQHDIALELRRPVALAGAGLFGASALVTLHLALAGSGAPSEELAAGALWIVLVFAALLGVGRVVAVEREDGTWDALLLAATDRSALFIGKAGAAFGLTLVLHAVLVPAYLVFFAAPPTGTGVLQLLAAVVLADLGFAAVGVLVGVLGLRARGRELLSATAFVPLVMPLVVASVALSLHAWGAGTAGDPTQLLSFGLAYAGTFLAAGLAAVPEIAVE